MKLSQKLFPILLAYFVFTYLVVVAAAVVMLSKANNEQNISYSVYASKPPVLFSLTEQLTGSDSRAAIIDQYFENHNCPMVGTGKKMVEVSDKYGFEYWWLPAIAWQESTCGKQIIEGSYNPFGFGIYGDNVIKFANWDDAIDRVGKELQKNYFELGLNEPCEVQQKYTPPSKGSWCESVKFFRDEMLNYKSPQTTLSD